MIARKKIHLNYTLYNSNSGQFFVWDNGIKENQGCREVFHGYFTKTTPQIGYQCKNLNISQLDAFLTAIEKHLKIRKKNNNLFNK